MGLRKGWPKGMWGGFDGWAGGGKKGWDGKGLHVYYLQGQGDLVSRLITPIAYIVTLVIPNH